MFSCAPGVDEELGTPPYSRGQNFIHTHTPVNFEGVMTNLEPVKRSTHTSGKTMTETKRNTRFLTANDFFQQLVMFRGKTLILKYFVGRIPWLSRLQTLQLNTAIGWSKCDWGVCDIRCRYSWLIIGVTIKREVEH